MTGHDAMVIDFKRAEMLPPGADKFFRTFSRFEFALKEVGFLPRKDGKAFANWHMFAAALGKEFFGSVSASGSADTLLHKPPKRQVSRNRVLSFDDTPPPKNTQQLLDAVCFVRNNLFHGGKSGEPDEDGSDPQRNEKLIAEAQWIIEQALLCHEEVRWAFEGRY